MILEPIYDTRASFYGKATINEVKSSHELVKELYSYNTLVARYILNFDTMIEHFEYLGKYSQTTTRHQKEFFKQLYLNDKELKELFKNGQLEKRI